MRLCALRAAMAGVGVAVAVGPSGIRDAVASGDRPVGAGVWLAAKGVAVCGFAVASGASVAASGVSVAMGAPASGPAQAAAPSVAKAIAPSNAWNCFTGCKSAFELLSTQL